MSAELDRLMAVLEPIEAELQFRLSQRPIDVLRIVELQNAIRSINVQIDAQRRREQQPPPPPPPPPPPIDVTRTPPLPAGWPIPVNGTCPEGYTFVATGDEISWAGCTGELAMCACSDERGCCQPNPSRPPTPTPDHACECINDALDSINESLRSISSALQRKVQFSCGDIDSCMDYILARLKEKIEHGIKSCDECRDMVKQGLGGTLEFAVSCAGACIGEVEKECGSMADEGKPCKKCGCEPCTCQDLECVSEDEAVCQPEEKAKVYVGWCNQETGDIRVLKPEDGTPGSGYTIVSRGDDESVVFDEAVRQCPEYLPPVQQPEPLQAVGVDTAFCDINAYADGSVANIIAQSVAPIFKAAGLSETVSSISRFGLEGINLGVAGEAIAGAVNLMFGSPPVIAETVMPAIGTALGCTEQQFVASAEVIGAFGIVNKLTGIDLHEFYTPYIYAMNSVCRVKQLDPSRAMDAYLSDLTGEFPLDAHFAVAGLCNEATNWAVQAAKSKLEPEQLVKLRHRELIDLEEYAAGFRQLGYLEPEVVENIFEISKHLPDISTVSRMNQAGITNEDNASLLGLDESNEPLMDGPLSDWLAGNGITTDVAKAFWRAHWLTPNIANLLEFWHRLRDLPEFNGENQLENAIDAALETNAIPRGWRGHYKAVMLQPLLKRDIRAAYTSGALPDDDLERVIKLTGHDDESVAILIKELRPARRQAVHSHVVLRNWVHQQIGPEECREQLKADGYDDETVTIAMRDIEFELERSSWAEAFTKGLMPRDQLIAFLTLHGVTDDGAIALANKLSFRIVDHQVVRDYIAGSYSRDNTVSRMLDDGLAQTTVDRLLRDADSAIDNSLTLDCVRGIKHRFSTGELNNDEATDLLTRRGIDESRVRDLVANFNCERNADGRPIAVEKLCNWLYLGVINQTDFYDRLIKLGYSEESASLLLFDCIQSNTLRSIKEAKRIATELQSAADKRQRAINKAEATKVRERGRLSKARAEKARLRSARDRQMLSAAEKLYKGTEATLQQSVDAVKLALDDCRTSYGLGTDDCLRIALLASEEMKGHAIGEFMPLVAQLASAAASDLLEPTDADIGLAPSTNGSTQPSG